MQINYAHNDTKSGERVSSTAQFVKLNIDSRVQAMREQAFQNRIPTANDETLNFLITMCRAVAPKNILELGTAIGISGICMLQSSQDALLTTVEREQNFYNLATENFKEMQLDNRTTLILGDAGEILEELTGQFDLIFMDSAKVQYVKYLPQLKRLLRVGGTLIADDVLLYGYVTGEVPTPKKRKMLVEHIKEYITAVTDDKDFSTTVLNIGDGIAVSVKVR